MNESYDSGSNTRAIVLTLYGIETYLSRTTIGEELLNGMLAYTYAQRETAKCRNK